MDAWAFDSHADPSKVLDARCLQDRVRGQQPEDRAAGILGRPDAGGRVLDSKTLSRVQTQAGGAEHERLGIRLGTNYPGSFAEYLTAPFQYVYSVEGLDPDTAVFTERAACAMHGLESAGIPPGASVLVFGAGPTGLLLSQLIRNGGASHVTVAASSQFKLDLALRHGIDDVLLMDRAVLAASVDALKKRSNGGFDVVVEATGVPAIGEVCVPLTRSRGTVMIYGVTAPDDRISISPFDVFRREITIKGSFAEINTFPATIAALRSGRARTEGLITHRYKLEDYGEALAALRGDRTVHKVVLEMS